MLAAVRLLKHGIPQTTVVTLMRSVRQQLESAHAQCLRKDPNVLFDEKRLRQQARPGTIAFSATEPIILVAAIAPYASQGDLIELAPQSSPRDPLRRRGPVDLWATQTSVAQAPQGQQQQQTEADN